MNESRRAQLCDHIQRTLEQMQASLRTMQQMRAELPGELAVALDLSAIEGVLAIAPRASQAPDRTALLVRV
jgi:hypothetical protein